MFNIKIRWGEVAGSEENNPPHLATESQPMETTLLFGERRGWETRLRLSQYHRNWFSQQLRWNDLFPSSVKSRWLRSAAGLGGCSSVFNSSTEAGRKRRGFSLVWVVFLGFCCLVQVAVTAVSRELDIFCMLEGQSLLSYCFVLE